MLAVVPVDFHFKARFLFDLPSRAKNSTPISSPATRTNLQRRYARPVEDRSKKNSFRSNPSMEFLTNNRAPVCDTSIIRQLRRQVPSIPIMKTSTPRSKLTRSCFLIPKVIQFSFVVSINEIDRFKRTSTLVRLLQIVASPVLSFPRHSGVRIS